MVFDVLEDAGIPVDPVVEGLPISLAELRDTSARIDWDVFARVLAGVERVCGDALPLEEIGARLLRVPSFEILRGAGQLLMGPKHLYEIAARLLKRFSMARDGRPFLSAARRVNRVVHVPSVLARSA
jgi:hypothetical protein